MFQNNPQYVNAPQFATALTPDNYTGNNLRAPVVVHLSKTLEEANMHASEIMSHIHSFNERALGALPAATSKGDPAPPTQCMGVMAELQARADTLVSYLQSIRAMLERTNEIL